MDNQTYSGLFLVAINPYQALPLYSDAIIHQYRGRRKDENPPHIFAIAERAWVNMGDERENQSILITSVDSLLSIVISTDIALAVNPVPAKPRARRRLFRILLQLLQTRMSPQRHQDTPIPHLYHLPRLESCPPSDCLALLPRRDIASICR